MGLQVLRFTKTDAPHANEGRRLERVGVPGSPCGNRRSLRSPIRAAKTGGTDNEAADSAERPRLSSWSCNGTPIPAAPFFDATGAVYATKSAVDNAPSTVHSSRSRRLKTSIKAGTSAFLLKNLWMAHAFTYVIDLIDFSCFCNPQVVILAGKISRLHLLSQKQTCGCQPAPLSLSFLSLSSKKRRRREEDGPRTEKGTYGENRSTRGENGATRGDWVATWEAPALEPCGFRPKTGAHPQVMGGVPVTRHCKKLCVPPSPLRVAPNVSGAFCAGGCGGRSGRAMRPAHESRSAATRPTGCAWRRWRLWKARGRVTIAQPPGQPSPSPARPRAARTGAGPPASWPPCWTRGFPSPRAPPPGRGRPSPAARRPPAAAF